jgi:hypothetical protein
VTFDKDTSTYTIHLKAVVADPGNLITRKELNQYRTQLEETIKQSYKGEKNGIKWAADVKLRVVDEPGEKDPEDHVFLIVGPYRMSGRGSTIQTKEGERGKVMRIQARTFRDRKDQQYMSPQSIGAHEFGHAAGLDDVHGDTQNLMSHDRVQGGTTITFDQFNRIKTAHDQGMLNKDLETFRRASSSRD